MFNQEITLVDMANPATITSLPEYDADLIVQSNNDKSTDKSLKPTQEAYADLQFAYDYFNKRLFNGKLPQCVLVYTRKRNVLGHFCPDRFQRVGGEYWPELSLNPTYLAIREDRESLSTLIHEQAHVGRHYYGPLNRRGGRGSNGYHDAPWADLMEAIGLMPSNTGLPGGKRTGYRMTHYIVEGGPFDIACRELLDSGFRINWHDRLVFASGAGIGGSAGDPDDAPQPQKKDRIKFTCSQCGLNAWAKPTARLSCTSCNRPMLAAGGNSSSLVKHKGRKCHETGCTIK